MNNTVYVLEDDESICELIKCTLQLNSIECQTFSTVREFRTAFSERVPAAVLLDIMLPDGNGLEVLSEIKRERPSVYCIMLSALNREIDKVKGLNEGADDYISKPFGVLELTARVNVALRTNKAAAISVMKSGNIEINRSLMSVRLGGLEVKLNKKEFELLTYLIENEGVVLSRETILNAVWGYDYGETRTLDNHVARLRKLGFTGVETVFGVGYKYIAEGNT